MKKLLKILGWTLLAVVVVAAGAGWWLYTQASAYYEQRWSPHQASFAMPFPLSPEEVTALHQERLAAGGPVSDPLAGVDLEAVARERAIARGDHLIHSRVGCNGCHGDDFGGKVILGTQFDYRGGHLVVNSLEQFRCFSVQNCRGLYDASAPLEQQALVQATFLPGGGNSVAFLEPGWFIKLRELSLTFEAPDRWARAFRASRLSLTLAGRNLWTITDYSGVDPEVNAFAQDNFASGDFESQAQVRYFTARLNVGF